MTFCHYTDKDKTPLEKHDGLVFKVECGVCHKQYIGDTERILSKRFKEHTDDNHPSSVVQEHINLTSHPVPFNLVKMLCNEDKTRRRMKEAIEIHKDESALNRDHGYENPPLPILLQLIPCGLSCHMELVSHYILRSSHSEATEHQSFNSQTQ